MKMNKILIVGFILGFFLMTMIPISAGHAVVGTAGSFSGDTPDQAAEDAWITVRFTALTSNAEFIIVPDNAGLGNHTFSTGTGETTKSINMKISASGSIELALYGYSVVTDTNSSVAIDTWLLTVTAKEDQNADQVTNLFNLFIGLAVAGILITIAFKKTGL